MKHKKVKAKVIAGLTMLLLLGGCFGKSETSVNTLSDDSVTVASAEYFFLDDDNPSEEGKGNVEKDFSGTKLVVWEDNKLDDYHAVINHVVSKVNAEGENPLGSEPFVAEGGCVRHGKHYYSDYRKSWDGVNGITAGGMEFELRLEVDPERIGNQIQTLGPISGKEGYVACYGEYRDGKYYDDRLYELDGSFQVVRSISSQMDGHGNVRYLMGDGEGNFHMISDAGNRKWDYRVVSSEGVILFEKEVGEAKLCVFDGGRVALCEKMVVDNTIHFGEVDLRTGEFAELIVSKDENIREMLKQFSSINAVTPLDDYQILLCTEEGVCLYNTQGKDAMVLYKWSHHGIFPQSVKQVIGKKDGSIDILYNDDSKECLYLRLCPTDEKEELKTITIATAPYNNRYDKIAILFQKQYPQYVIDIKKDYEQTRLLTQLGAGEGPVLIDTALTGFEELEELWQPLDGFLDQTQLAKELLPKTLEFGKISGTTYGIVPQFYIDTLLVAESGLSDWDYEGFLNALESFDGAPYADVMAEGKWSDQREKFFDFFSNGIGDNYFFDIKTGKTLWGTTAFERLLNLSQKASKCPPTESWSAVLNGEALCEREYVFSVQHAIRLRRESEKKGIRVIGYPTKDGGKARVVGGSPLAIRCTATDEEKRIAYTFLKVCLSKEAADFLGDSLLSVRKDAIEDAFRKYQEQVELEKSLDAYSPYDPEKWPELDWKRDTEYLYDMIENGIVQKEYPVGLKYIFDEELGDYLSGRIDGKALEDHLKSRVWLYLEEAK